MKEKRTVIHRNPVVRTGKWAVSLIRNKLVASLMMLAQGILFIVAPRGDVQGTVRIAAAVVVAACAVNTVLHLMQKDKGFIHYALAAVNVLFAASAFFCLASPQTVEPFFRVIIGAITVLTAAVNLAETLRIENRKSWQFAAGVIVAIVMLGLGVTMIAAGTDKVELMQQSGGFFLIISALLNIWYIIRLRQAKA